MEVTLDEFAEFFAVGIAHVHEFDAAAVRADIADDGGEIDFAETGANFQFDRVADAEFSGGFQIGAAQANGLYASKTRARSEEHTSELQSHLNLVCRLLLEKKKNNTVV